MSEITLLESLKSNPEFGLRNGANNTLLDSISGGTLDSVALKDNVKNITITEEANSFLLKWTNPNSKAFSYTQIRMTHCSKTDYSSHPEHLDFANAEIIYTGSGEFFNYVVPTQYNNHLFNFWICAFAGSPIPVHKLESWQDVVK